jgi:hypothetical protein
MTSRAFIPTARDVSDAGPPWRHEAHWAPAGSAAELTQRSRTHALTLYYIRPFVSVGTALALARSAGLALEGTSRRRQSINFLFAAR